MTSKNAMSHTGLLSVIGGAPAESRPASTFARFSMFDWLDARARMTIK
jgi:hypothetical protein